MAPSVNLPFGLRAQGIEWASERSCSRGPSYRETLVLGMVHLPGFGLKSMALHREGWVEKPCGPRRFSQSTDLLAVNALPRSFRRWRMASLWHWWPSTIMGSRLYQKIEERKSRGHVSTTCPSSTLQQALRSLDSRAVGTVGGRRMLDAASFACKRDPSPVDRRPHSLVRRLPLHFRRRVRVRALAERILAPSGDNAVTVRLRGIRVHPAERGHERVARLVIRPLLNLLGVSPRVETWGTSEREGLGQ